MKQRRNFAGAVSRRIAGALLLVVLAVAPVLAADGTISGTIKDAAGTPLAGAVVAAYDANNNLYRVTSGDDGTYSIGVPPGTYSVTAVGLASVETTLANLQVADGQALANQDLQLKAATPFPIVKATTPIPLTAGIDSPEFADAPEIRIDQPWQVSQVDGDVTPNAWGGPNHVSGRLKLKYDATNFYVAADLTFANNRLNSNPGGDPWKGNALEIYLQNDAFDPNRTAYDPNHNWQVVIGLGPTPAVKLYGAIQADITGDLAQLVSVTDKAENKGVLVRANLPWSSFLKEDQTGSPAPADESLGGIGIGINAADPNGDPADPSASIRRLQLMGLAFGNANWTNPSSLRPAVFTAKAP